MKTLHTTSLLHTLLSALLGGLSLVVLAVVVWMAGARVDRYLDLQAMADCAEHFRLEYHDEQASTTIIRPLDDLYRQCLREKGVK